MTYISQPNTLGKTVETNNVRESTIKNGGKVIALDNNSNEFADLANFAEDDFSNQNPLIPDFVYDNLPEILKDGSSAFSDLRQRDIFLTGALSVISGCISPISGVYDGNILFANLFSFITAPAASGKGSLNHCKVYGITRHRRLLASTSEGKSKRILFIPGNASSSALISHLNENEGKGIFFETEADTLSATFKNEWGNFSDLLRKGFHHEGVSYTRKANNEYINLEQPKLSVVLSGTPNQVKSLISSTENGLFSRFIFYSFQSPLQWNDVSPNGKSNNNPQFFKNIEERSDEIIHRFNQYNAIDFTLTKDQWCTLNIVQETDLTIAASEYGDNVSSVMKRTGVMWFRMAMILSAIRYYDNIDESVGLACSDIDFEIAKKLMETYKIHILSVYSSLPEQPEFTSNSMLAKLYSYLPDEFKRMEAVKIGLEKKMSPRSVDTFLQQLVKQHKLEKGQLGQYAKIK